MFNVLFGWEIRVTKINLIAFLLCEHLDRRIEGASLVQTIDIILFAHLFINRFSNLSNGVLFHVRIVIVLRVISIVVIWNSSRNSSLLLEELLLIWWWVRWSHQSWDIDLFFLSPWEPSTRWGFCSGSLKRLSERLFHIHHKNTSMVLSSQYDGLRFCSMHRLWRIIKLLPTEEAILCLIECLRDRGISLSGSLPLSSSISEPLKRPTRYGKYPQRASKRAISDQLVKERKTLRTILDMKGRICGLDMFNR